MMKGYNRTKPVFDEEDLLLRLEGNRELAKALLADTLTQFGMKIGELKDAVSAGDLKSARLHAHYVKELSMHAAAPAMNHVASDIELAIARADWKKTKSLLWRLDSQLGSLRMKLGKEGWAPLCEPRLEECVRIGIHEFDEQHGSIFEGLDVLSECGSGRDDAEKAALVMKETLECIRMHTWLEEEYMDLAGHPDLNRHRQEHNSLIAHVKLLSKEMRGAKKLTGSETAPILARWLRMHILKMDAGMKGV